MNFPSFKSFFIESIEIIHNNELIFNYQDYSKEKQSTKFGKDKKFTPFKTQNKMTFGYPVYSIYKFDKNVEIIKAIKKQSMIKINPQDYEHFLKRSAIYITYKLLKNIDVIVAPQSSSFILYDLLEEIKKRNPHIKIITDAFKKNPIEKIEIDFENFNIDDKTKRNLERTLNKMKQQGYFELKKFPKRFTDLIKNVIDKTSNLKYKYIENKNIAIIDDFYGTGFTMKHMIEILKSFNPKNIIGITLFKKVK